MNKKYIDFVPTDKKSEVKTGTKPSVKAQSVPATHKVASRSTTVSASPAVRSGVKPVTMVKPRKKVMDMTRPVRRTATSAKPTAAPRVTPKPAVVSKATPKASAKPAPRTSVKPMIQVAQDSVRSTSIKSATLKTGATYVPPKNAFISYAKIEKRPLSKTVYNKKITVPKEEPHGPITIISKPEKQNHAGLIVTIILTIIMGAAAGTVAFMLLPK